MGFSRFATLDFYACPVLHRIKNTGVCVERPDMDRVLGLASRSVKPFDLVPKHARVFEPMIEEKRLKLFTGEGASALVFDTSGEFGLRDSEVVTRIEIFPGNRQDLRLWRVYRE